MNQDSSLKFPQSAQLFKFCRHVLDHKFGAARVIDQDVGQILKFDPADCSHWKKGKKHIRTIQAMKAIADHLDVEEQLVIDLASGNLDEGEAFYEYLGYGEFTLDPKHYETAKKDMMKRLGHGWSREKEQELKGWFVLNQTAIEAAAQEVLDAIRLEEPPLFLPEISTAFPAVTFVGVPSSAMPNSQEPTATALSPLGLQVQYANDVKMGPFLRFSLARAAAPWFLRNKGLLIPEDVGSVHEAVTRVQSNVFAAYLLTPTPMVQRELAKISANRSIVTQLADMFWVSKGFMNRRLKTILASGV